jgi:CHAD domain-containing protein
MEYTLRPAEPVSDEIKRIIHGKVESGIEHIDGEMETHETVHEVRKRCKEVRAAVRLVRPVLPTYSEVNAHYRDAGRRLSDVRDAHAAIETFDAYVRPLTESEFDEDRLLSMRRTLVKRRDELLRDTDLDQRLAAVRADLVEGQERVQDLPIATDGYEAVAGGLRKSYRRARNRMEDAYEEPEFERFHEWRKRIKYHRYHTRLLRRVWVDPMKERRSQLKRLSDVIGDENDLAEFAILMHDEELFESEERETLDRLIRGKRSELHRRGRPLGERLFAESPDRLVERIGAYWEATREFDPDP